jgi:hypothetical protein
MFSHLLALVLFSGLVSAVLATLARDEPRQRASFGLRLFVGLVLSVMALGWAMRGLPS